MAGFHLEPNFQSITGVMLNFKGGRKNDMVPNKWLETFTVELWSFNLRANCVCVLVSGIAPYKLMAKVGGEA